MRKGFSLVFLAVPGSLALAQPSALQVMRAEWGAGRTWADVTQRVRAIVDSRQPSFRVDTEALGRDPLPGTPKTLRVRLRTSNGRVQAFEYKDLETVQLRSWTGAGWGRFPGAGGRPGSTLTGGLRILSAQYGEGQRQNDVTAILHNAIQGDALAIQVTNENMGGDPAPAVVKRLTVRYQWQNQTYDSTVPENGWLRLPDAAASPGAVTPTPVSPGLRIVEASYGEGSRQLDVTSRLQALVANDRLNVNATNEALGGDPARGARKKLTVVYEWQGNRYEASVHEYQNLSLPRSGDRLVEAASATGGADDSGRFFDTADQIWKLNGDGVCFYRQAYFKGDAVCVLSGRERAVLSPDGNPRFLSVRFFGNARQVQVWNQPNFSGRSGRFTRDETDLNRVSISVFGVGGTTGDIGSARVN